MNSKKRVSVVMPTFNEEKYIETQLESVLHQTRKPDEIIISDDGSTDTTLNRIYRMESCNIKIVVLQDNPNHGWIGNYEWASSHATGDYIFNCDQDDIWVENKIERVLRVFELHPEALLVAHNINVIDASDELLGEALFDSKFINYNKSDIINLKEDSRYFLRSCSQALFTCHATCIKRELLLNILPFPKQMPVDHWEPFCALVYGNAYYVNETLVMHRLHNANLTTGDGRIKDKFLRLLSRAKTCKFSINPYYGGKAMLDLVEESNISDDEILKEITAIINLGNEKKKISEYKFSVLRVWKYIELYFNNNRLRKSGKSDIIYDLIALFFNRMEE